MIRVFPRKTKASPDDSLVYFGEPPVILPKSDEVHVSCVFTWDKGRAEYLARQWAGVHPNVRIGGVAFGDHGGDFMAGKYLKHGNTITSRGCNNKCWYCDVHKREGGIRELPIVDGWNLLDSNILQCSESHIRNVFAMLKRQKRKAEFTGGLQASLLQDWHIDLLLDLKPKQIFFAYDKADDFAPLVDAGKKLLEAGFTRASHTLRCYVLIGTPEDSIESAERRLSGVMALGFTPMAMLWKNKSGETDVGWRQFQRQWARPKIIHRNNQ